MLSMDAKSTLKHYFGYDSFRGGQEEVVNAILEGRDVLAIMPTGAGNPKRFFSLPREHIR